MAFNVHIRTPELLHNVCGRLLNVLVDGASVTVHERQLQSFTRPTCLLTKWFRMPRWHLFVYLDIVAAQMISFIW